MIQVVCAVYDNAVRAFAQPFFVATEGVAIRSFTDACADDKLPFKAHPEDYTLMFLGTWDDGKGQFVQEQTGPRPLLRAQQVVAAGIAPPM